MKFEYCLLSALLFPLSGLAADIDTLFPYAAQSHSADGEIEMDEGSYIVGTREMSGSLGYIDFKNINDDDDDDDKKNKKDKKDKDDNELEGECDDQDCKLSYYIGDSADLPNFKKNKPGSDLVINEDSTKTLSPGEYWYDKVELKDGSMLTSSGAVTLYIKEKLDLGEEALLGDSQNPVNIFVYGGDDGDDGDVELDKDAVIYGFVYVEGELDLDEGAGIYGAVNVIDLDMDKDSFINNLAQTVAPENVFHHYNVDYKNGALTAYACADIMCDNLYKDKNTKLHLTEDNGNNGQPVKFHNLEGGFESVGYKMTEGQCVTLKKQANGNSTNPDGPLRCFVDGDEVDDCRICSGEATPTILVAYVYESLDLESALPQAISGYSYTVGDIKYYGENANRILTDKANDNPLSKGDSITFPPVVSYNKAEKIELAIKGDNGKKNKKKKEVEYKLELAFVPYRIEVQPHTDCPQATEEFVYATHSDCPVLAKAGEQKSLPLSFVGYGVNADGTGKGRKIEGYKFDIPKGNLVKINEISSSAEGGITFSEVATIQASVDEHCASYAPECGNKKTKSSISTIGRTVPDRLLITGRPGQIKNNIAYRGKDVSFTKPPQFTVRACAVGQTDKECNLISYSGEFAKGLLLDDVLTFTPGDGFGLSPDNVGDVTLDDDQTGLHSIKLPEDTKLAFDKVDKQPEQTVDHELSLAIKIDEDGKLEGNSSTKVADGAMLRYGYLVLEDTELPVETEGHIKGKLYYLDQLKKSKPVTENHFSFANHIADGSNIAATAMKPNDATPPILAVDNDGLGTDGIGVAKYKQAAEFKVTLEVDKWLQPHNGSGLVQPTAQLKFTEDSRKRGNDSTFNRREVIR